MHHELRARVPQRSALITVVLIISMALVGSGAAVALASDCAALGGALAAGECQITTAVVASDSAHGGPFTVDETLHITPTGSITVPATAGGNSLTLKITGDLVMDVPTGTGSRIVGDAPTAAGDGATLVIEASGSITLIGNGTVGARISSNQTGGSCAGGKGGDISLKATGTIVVDKGASITSKGACPGGEIIIDAGLGAAIAGTVLSEGTSSVGRGGPISIISSCTLAIEEGGQVVSRGRDPGADLVHLEGGCSVVIYGLVASTGPGHATPLQNRCSAPERPDKPDNAPACIEVWSGGPIVVDRASHGAEINADTAQSGGVKCCAWIDLYAAGDIKILGSTASAVYAVHANQTLTNGFGGLVTVKSTGGQVTASGKAIQASDTAQGGHAGVVTIEAKQDVILNEALLLAKGDSTPTYGSGGLIEARAFGGVLSWINAAGGAAATGDVQPTGSGVDAAIRGVIDLRACGAITTTGTLFPVTNGAATAPTQTAGLCPPSEPAAPTLPGYVALPTCICELPQADVSVAKSTSTPSVTVGGAVVYSITVSASGTADSTNVVLTDVVPAGTGWTVGGADATGHCSPLAPAAGATVTCSFGTMSPGSTRTITLTGKATAASCPAMKNTAVVSSDNDSQPDNNTSGPIPVTVGCTADASVVKTTTTPKITAGGTAKYSITVKAEGTGPSTDVVLTDILPAGLTWTITGDTATCTVTGQTLTCHFGTMAAGTSKTVNLSASATGALFADLMLATHGGWTPPPPKCVTISNTATITSSNDTKSGNNSSGPVVISVDCKPDVSVSKKAVDSSIKPGEKAEYTITVTAGGTGSSSNVVLTDVVPSGYTWTVGGTDASFCTPATVAGGQTLTCSFGSMAQGSTRTIKLSATTPTGSCGYISNTAKVSADVDTYSSNNISGPVKIAVKCPDVSVVKTTSTPWVKPGDYAKYSITVTANGPGASTNVKLTDVVPSGLTWTVEGANAAECTSTTVSGGSTLTCNFGTMAEGTTKTITLKAKLPSSAHSCPSDLYNTAQVTATNDGNTSNNKSGPIKIDVKLY